MNPSTKTIFILDAKNVNKKLFTSAIERELRQFFHGGSKKKSYLEKLNLKVDFVINNLDKVLENIKILELLNFSILKEYSLFNSKVTDSYNLIDFLKIIATDDYEQRIINVILERLNNEYL